MLKTSHELANSTEGLWNWAVFRINMKPLASTLELQVGRRPEARGLRRQGPEFAQGAGQGSHHLHRAGLESGRFSQQPRYFPLRFP